MTTSTGVLRAQRAERAAKACSRPVDFSERMHSLECSNISSRQTSACPLSRDAARGERERTHNNTTLCSDEKNPDHAASSGSSSARSTGLALRCSESVRPGSADARPGSRRGARSAAPRGQARPQEQARASEAPQRQECPSAREARRAQAACSQGSGTETACSQGSGTETARTQGSRAPRAPLSRVGSPLPQRKVDLADIASGIAQ